MKISRFLTILGLTAIMITGCRHAERRTMTNDEEERLYALVAEPSSEGDLTRAIAAADSLLTTELSDSLRGYIMVERGVAIINSGDTKRAAAYADTIRTYGEDYNLMEARIQAESICGIAARRELQYDSAIAHYGRGIELALEAGDKEWEQHLTDLAGIAYVERGHFDEALEYLKRSLQLARELDDTTAIVSTLGTIGGVYVRDTRGDASERINRNKLIITELPPPIGLIEGQHPLYQIKYLSPLAYAYLSLDSIRKGRELIASIDSLAAPFPPEHQAHVQVLQLKALLAAKEHHPEERMRLYDLLDSMSEHGRSAQISDIERAQCLADLGRYREAYERQREAYDKAETEHQEKVNEAMADMNARYNTAVKELEIEKLSHRQWVLTFIIVVCLLTILLGVLAWMIIWRNRRNREAIARQAEYIRGLEQERSRMARELHDDIAGDLVGLQYGVMSMSSNEASERIGSIARKTRALSHELMPPEFKNHTLPELLRDFARSRSYDGGGTVSVVSTGDFDWHRLEPGVSYELYRIVQEGVNNAQKHSAPGTAVEICLRGNETYEITISGNAKISEMPGVSAKEPGVGMRIMKTRAELAGANFEAEERDGRLILKLTEK